MNVDRPKPGQHAGQGDLVLIAPNGPRAGHGRVLRRLGRPDVARDVLEVLMLDRGLRRRFDPLVEREARTAAQRTEAGPERRDLRALPTFTIDPPTARDFDDAISAERLHGGVVRVWVHIADVAAHVPPGSAVDREAYRRGTSVYVPGKVEPMLPEALSNDACSLVPHQDRLAVTVELDLDGADVLRTAFHRSVIRSDARLDYPRVDRVFAGRERAESPWATPLEAARGVARALEDARAARGALAVESVEPEFDFSREGHVTGVEPSQQTESHKLIEHLMIAANEAVATFLESRRLPALYRVHDRPEPRRVALLAGIGAGEIAPAASAMEGAGEWCSTRERDAAVIERAADDVARAFLLESRLFRSGWHTEFPGEVIGVIGAGAFVAFGDDFEGLLPVRRLRGDWWELDPLEVMLRGGRSGKAIRLGDPATVQVVRVDAPRGR